MYRFWSDLAARLSLLLVVVGLVVALVVLQSRHHGGSASPGDIAVQCNCRDPFVTIWVNPSTQIAECPHCGRIHRVPSLDRPWESMQPTP